MDGAHIRTLLLTFLFRYQRALFEKVRPVAGTQRSPPALGPLLMSRSAACAPLHPTAAKPSERSVSRPAVLALHAAHSDPLPLAAPLQGHVYVGVPPLYKLDLGRGKSQYCYTEEELRAATAQLAPGSYHVQRFKVSRLLRGQRCRVCPLHAVSQQMGGCMGWHQCCEHVSCQASLRAVACFPWAFPARRSTGMTPGCALLLAQCCMR